MARSKSRTRRSRGKRRGNSRGRARRGGPMSVTVKCTQGPRGRVCRQVSRAARRSARRRGAVSGNGHVNHGQRLSLRRVGLVNATPARMQATMRVIQKQLNASKILSGTRRKGVDVPPTTP